MIAQDEAAEKLGIPLEELEQIRKKALAELNTDDSWERELDAKNKARAGISVDPNMFVPKKRKVPLLPFGVSRFHNNLQANKFTVYFSNGNPPDLSSTGYVKLDGKTIFSEQIPYYCHACAISETGKYVAFQTANGTGGAAPQFMLYVLAQPALLWHKTMPTGWKDLLRIEVSEVEKSIKLHYACEYVEYDFDGNAVQPEQIYDYWLKYGDAYTLEFIANELIVENKIAFTEKNEQRILYIIGEIEECLYPNRLSLTFKALGECYESIGMNAKALSAYQKGLGLNPSLSVKKAIKRLTPLK